MVFRNTDEKKKLPKGKSKLTRLDEFFLQIRATLGKIKQFYETGKIERLNRSSALVVFAAKMRNRRRAMRKSLEFCLGRPPLR